MEFGYRDYGTIREVKEIKKEKKELDELEEIDELLDQLSKKKKLKFEVKEVEQTYYDEVNEKKKPKEIKNLKEPIEKKKLRVKEFSEISEGVELHKEVDELNSEGVKLNYTKHTYPLLLNKIFRYLWKTPKNRISSIIIDLEGFLPIFFDNVKNITEKYHWQPDYYLLEVISTIHEKLSVLKYWPTIFFVYSDFEYYLLPKRDNRDLEKSKLYSGTEKEARHFSKEVFPLFKQIRKNTDYYLEMLQKAQIDSVKSIVKIISNHNFEEDNFVGAEVYLKNIWTYKLDLGMMQLYNENNEPIGDPFFVLNLPKDIQDKIKKELQPKKVGRPKGDPVARIKTEIIKQLATGPEKYKNLRKKIKGGNVDFQSAFKELRESETIEKTTNKWELKK